MVEFTGQTNIFYFVKENDVCARHSEEIYKKQTQRLIL